MNADKIFLCYSFLIDWKIENSGRGFEKFSFSEKFWSPDSFDGQNLELLAKLITEMEEYEEKCWLEEIKSQNTWRGKLVPVILINLRE